MNNHKNKHHLSKDERIVDLVKDQLEEKMQASAMDINVTARDGVVQLTGFSDVLSEKQLAEKITETIPDVRSVNNNITIAMDSNIKDKHMEKDIRNMLKKSPDGDRLSGVGIKVYDGVADLIGHVDDLQDAHTAMELAAQSRGIKDVVNNIDISSVGEVDDASIKNGIIDKLHAHPISTQELHCDVTHGRVTLTGFVGSHHDVEIAKELAMDVNGVKKVITKLQTKMK